VAGLAATSPSVTGKKLKDNKAPVQAYEQYAKGVSDKISDSIKAAVPSANIASAYTTVYGGVAAKVPANSIADLLKVAGVTAVQQDNLNHKLDDNTAFIGATAVWPSLGGSSKAGANVIVGVIDTGVWARAPNVVADGRRLAHNRQPAVEMPVRRRQRHGPPRSDVRMQQKAYRRVRVHHDVHEQRRVEWPGVLQQHDENMFRP
jgi:hypothetical protein